MKGNARHRFRRAYWIFSLGATLALFAAGLPIASAQQANDIVVPSGYQVREVASGLGAAIASSVAPNGDLYVLASGFPGFEAGAKPGPVEIWKVTAAGQTSKVYSSATTPGLVPVALGIAAKDEDTIFVNDADGLKRLHKDGSTQLLAKLPNLGDHNNDHIAFGPDGKLYWGEGSATNSGVVGQDNEDLTGWLKAHPDFHDVPCTDVTLTGTNFQSKDVLSSDPNATTMTGPYLPFGTTATPGQVITGQTPCTSSVLRMNQDGTGLEVVAWGFRNPFSLAFAPADSLLKGALVVSNNGADVRGSRPIESDGDDLFIVHQGGWYGWPDYLDEQPVTEPRFKPADGPAPTLLLQSPSQGDAISAVTHFPKGVSADGFAFSTSDSFGWRNDAFVALWGPLGFGAQPASTPGYNIYRVHFTEGPNGVVGGAEKDIFVRNKMAGAASQNGLNGLEHPSDVKFSPDGATMYITDFGQPPSKGGRVWAVTRTTGPAGGGVGPAPAPAAPAPAPAAPAAPAPAAPAPGAAESAVTIAGFAFQPADLTVAAGTNVTWTNTDSVAHTVTWDDKSVDSGLFGQGETFSHTFDTPGTYGYYCIPHGSPGAGMHGSVTVTGG
jgi:plastocyanin/glucose/arabinose dehydrogenase